MHYGRGGGGGGEGRDLLNLVVRLGGARIRERGVIKFKKLGHASFLTKQFSRKTNCIRHI